MAEAMMNHNKYLHHHHYDDDVNENAHGDSNVFMNTNYGDPSNYVNPSSIVKDKDVKSNNNDVDDGVDRNYNFNNPPISFADNNESGTTTASTVANVNMKHSEKRSYKMVNFEPLPVIHKKARPSVEHTAQTITLAIQHAVNESNRKEALQNACVAFDHGVEEAHDDEIRVGADIALFKQLTFLQYLRMEAATKASTTDDELVKEIHQLLEGLEMVLRCSADCVAVSFARIGVSLLPILLSYLNEVIYQRKNSSFSIIMTSITNSSTDSATTNMEPSNVMDTTSSLMEGGLHDSHDSYLMHSQERPEHASNRCHASSIDTEDSHLSNHGDASSATTTTEEEYPTFFISQFYNNSVQIPSSMCDKIAKTTTKIMGHFARVGSITTTLASTNYLLSTLRNIISMPQGSIPIESQMNALWVIANLACSANNMIRMARHPKLIDILVQVASRPDTKDETLCNSSMAYLKIVRCRSIAVRALLNLSWAHDNKIPMSENPLLIQALLSAVTHRDSNWVGNGLGVSGVLLQSRRLAAGALRNIAAAPRRYKRRLCRSHESQFLDFLADVAINDTDEDVRCKIHATFFNLVSADTAKLFIEKQALLNVIVQTAAGSGDPYGLTQSGDDCCTMAVRTLKALERAIPEEQDDYEILRPILRQFDSQIAFDKSQSTNPINLVHT